MNIALVTGHTENYKDMADITLPGKEEYAARHGYRLFVQLDGWDLTKQIGMEKCRLLEIIMDQNPDVEWFWWTGTDCLITNHTITLESLIDENFHFIVCKDDGGINADVFFIRNSEEGKRYLKRIQRPHHLGSEQANMWDAEHEAEWSNICKYIPQNRMNSYNLKYYAHKRKQDVFGERNNWEQGDFVLQAVTGFTPNLNVQQIYEWKINQLKEVVDLIVK